MWIDLIRILHACEVLTGVLIEKICPKGHSLASRGDAKLLPEGQIC